MPRRVPVFENVSTGRTPNTPLPGYDDAVHGLSLMETTFATRNLEGRPTPLHIREKIAAKLLLFCISVTCISLQQEISMIDLAMLQMTTFISLSAIITILSIDDISTAVSSLYYRQFCFAIETLVSILWIISVGDFVDLSLSDPQSTAVFVTCLLVMFSWIYMLGMSTYKLFMNQEQLMSPGATGIYPHLLMDDNGRLAPDPSSILWLAQPRNKARMFEIVNCACILIIGDRKWADIVYCILTIIFGLSFCFSSVWRKRLSIATRLIAEFTYESIFLIVGVVIMVGSREVSPSITTYFLIVTLVRCYALIWICKTSADVRAFPRLTAYFQQYMAVPGAPDSEPEQPTPSVNVPVVTSPSPNPSLPEYTD